MTTLRQICGGRMAIVALWSLLLTTLLIGGALSTEKAYYETHPFFFDPAAYCSQGAMLYQQLAAIGHWHLALNQWFNNPIHPLDTTIRLAFWPETFRYSYGHLSVTAPILAVSFFVLAWTISQRTRSLLYACAVTAFFCALPFFQDPVWGLGAYWLDPPAALLSGSAMLCLMNVNGSRSMHWLVGFSVFAALAALDRYIAAIYTVLLCGPILAWRLIQLSRIHRGSFKGGLLPLSAACLPGLLLAGPFLVRHFHFNMMRYTSVGYGLGHSVKEAFLMHVTLISVLWLSDPLFSSSVVGLLVLTLWFAAGEKTLRWDTLLISLWVASAVFLFEIFVLRAEAAHTLIYAIPGMFFALVSPVPMSYLNSKRLRTVASCIIVLIALRCGMSLHAKAMRSAHELNALDEKEFYKAVGERLAQLGGNNVTWAAMFDECAYLIELEAFYRFGALPFSEPVLSSLSIHESYYKSYFPNADPAAVCQKVYDRQCRRMQFILVFDDPAAVERANFDNDYTKSVARFAAQKVRVDALVWQWIFSLDHKRFGRISGYKNLSFNRANLQ
jgi:hypothetical protein